MTQLNIIELIKLNPSITQKEMATSLDLTRDTIKYNIALLKKFNILLREGSTKKGKWIIKLTPFIQSPLQTLEDTKHGKNLSKTFDTVDEMFEDLDKN